MFALEDPRRHHHHPPCAEGGRGGSIDPPILEWRDGTRMPRRCRYSLFLVEKGLTGVPTLEEAGRAVRRGWSVLDGLVLLRWRNRIARLGHLDLLNVREGEERNREYLEQGKDTHPDQFLECIPAERGCRAPHLDEADTPTRRHTGIDTDHQTVPGLAEQLASYPGESGPYSP